MEEGIVVSGEPEPVERKIKRRKSRKNKRRVGAINVMANRNGNAREDVHLRQFERQFGRNKIIDALVVAQDQDPRMKILLELMLDPVRAKSTFATLTVAAGVTLMDFLKSTRAGYVELAVAQASQMAPKVLRDIAVDAMTKQVPCAQCKGEGVLGIDGEGVPIECWTCQGKKKVNQSGDKAARDQFLEATGVITRKGGITFNQQINANLPGMNPFESTIARATKVLED